MGNLTSVCAKPSVDVGYDVIGEAQSGSSIDLGFLSSVDLFKRLPEESSRQVARICIPATYTKNEAVVTQGALGNEFFVIKTGTASVWIRAEGGDKDVKVAILGPGDYFGETSLLRDVPRTATVKAVTDLECLKITRADFFEMHLHEKLDMRARRGAAVAQGPNLAAKPPSPKVPEEEKLISEALRKNRNLEATVPLSEDRIKQIIAFAWKENVVAGTQLITEGDKDATFFYIIQDGAFNVVKSDVVDKDLNSLAVGLAKAQVVATISKGTSFGELALLYNAPRAATVEAATDAVVWVIDRTNFQNILQSSADELHKTYVGYLNKVEILSPLTGDEKLQIAKALQEMAFSKDENIIEQGEEGHDFYILTSGELQVIKDGAVLSNLVASSTKYVPFGERALLTKEPRAATIKVISEEARLLKLDKPTFEALVGPLAEIKEGKRRRGSSAAPPPPANNNGAEGGAKDQGKAYGVIKRKDLKTLSLLGCGGFGAVKLVQHQATKECYALKEVSKGFLVQQNMQVRAMREKDVQMMCNSPFIVKLYETYTDAQTLYLLLEVALGGELFYTYFRKGFHGSEKHARFYVAGTALAFEHMHERHIVYRDLKPENILLNSVGHLKITDMGLAKVVMGKTFTTCGTPEYFAPELIASTGHNQAVDWWALGILLFELMAGHTPFEASKKNKDSDIMQIFKNIKNGIGKVSFPPHFTSTLTDLISRLCSKEPAMRPPMRKGGLRNLKHHPWYEVFAWDAMVNLTMDPPYKPKVKSPTDVTHFRVSKEDMPPQIPYKDDKSGWDKDFATST